jgi:hypothetical protein
MERRRRVKGEIVEREPAGVGLLTTNVAMGYSSLEELEFHMVLTSLKMQHCFEPGVDHGNGVHGEALQVGVDGNIAVVGLVDVGATSVEVTNRVRLANLAAYQQYFLVALCRLANVLETE